jgi:hypothetical protein
MAVQVSQIFYDKPSNVLGKFVEVNLLRRAHDGQKMMVW